MVCTILVTGVLVCKSERDKPNRKLMPTNTQTNNKPNQFVLKFEYNHVYPAYTPSTSTSSGSSRQCAIAFSMTAKAVFDQGKSSLSAIKDEIIEVKIE